MALAQAKRERCPAGHPYDLISGGRRRCLRCKRERYTARRRTIVEYLWARFKKASNGCWLWTGTLHREGYGVGSFRGREFLAHREMYALLVEPIPDGLTIDHLCRQRNCVNPAHLEPVTLAENVLRGNGFSAKNARKTECPAGHPYTAENTGRTPLGHRYCRECARLRQRRQKGVMPVSKSPTCAYLGNF